VARVRLTDDAREDLRDLDGAAQRLVLKGLKKLESEPEKRGAPLGSRNDGNLTTFRKLVVGNRNYRIVYQVEPNGDVVVVWVIGRRADAEVYQLAVSRLRMYPDRRVAQEVEQLMSDVARATGLQDESTERP
jgi:mRNA interferase RelE/StbE